MSNLETLNVNTTDIPFTPLTHIMFIMKNGAQFDVDTPLSSADFTKIWDAKKNKVKIITGNDTFAYINKRRVDCFRVFQI